MPVAISVLRVHGARSIHTPSLLILGPAPVLAAPLCPEPSAPPSPSTPCPPLFFIQSGQPRPFLPLTAPQLGDRPGQKRTYAQEGTDSEDWISFRNWGQQVGEVHSLTSDFVPDTRRKRITENPLHVIKMKGLEGCTLLSVFRTSGLRGQSGWGAVRGCQVGRQTPRTTYLTEAGA